MKKRSDSHASDDPAIALSTGDRDATIDRLYDVALDPSRYEALLDHWESAIGPLRAQADFREPRLLDDPLIAGHFERASAFLDRVDPNSHHDEIEKILSPFDHVPALLLKRDEVVCAANAAAKSLMNAQIGSRLRDLPLHEEDIDAVIRTFHSVLSDSKETTAILRVRASQQGHFTVLRLQLCHSADGQPLVLAASNEVSWPVGFGDILRKAFKLTGAEASVIQGLVECCSVQDIATKRNRSVDTIRAQIKSILSKTETHSQLELIRLALSMMDMMSLTVDATPGPRVVSRGRGALEEREFRSLVSPDGRRVDYLILGDAKGSQCYFYHWIMVF